MTHDERIEAMAKAHWLASPHSGMFSKWEDSHPVTVSVLHEQMEAALAAAGLEEVVRSAAVKAACAENQYQWGIDSSDIDEIVKEVMGR